MKILALEPFYGGSHKAFLAGWQRHSEHEFTILGLPGYKWKWRMRHAAVTFANQLASDYANQNWDVLWCSDMLNLPEFLGLVRNPTIQGLPRVLYFHENQLTYPVRDERERDLHFAFSNFTSAMAADRVWFNSQFHRDTFLRATEKYLSRMPDFQLTAEVERIERKSEIQYPGVDVLSESPIPEPARGQDTSADPLHIGWLSRWEHDKNPDDFFAALRILKSRGLSFRLSVLGESFKQVPEVFGLAEREFANEIKAWGFLDSVKSYFDHLRRLDVVVSTATHEFFGMGVVEAIQAGAYPLLPNRLAYPEVLKRMELGEDHLFDGSIEDLARKLVDLLSGNDLSGLPKRVVTRNPFAWPLRVVEMDQRIVTLVQKASNSR